MCAYIKITLYEMSYGTRYFLLFPLSLKFLTLSQVPVLPEIFSDAYILLVQ